MAGSSGLHFARVAFRSGLISRRRIAGDIVEGVRFRLQGSTDERTDRVRARMGEYIGGVRARDLQRLGPQVLSSVLPRMYPEMLAVAYEHQDAGRPIYICTAASNEMAELLAHVLGFDGGLGSRSEVVDGVYTGLPGGVFAYRDGKAQIMQDVAAAEGLDLAASYAYSDSESDLPMLRAVGHPVAVNPDAALLRVARVEGWEILRFDRLRRRLVIGAAAIVAAAAGGVGRSVVLRRTPPAPARSALTQRLARR